jgi:hypothetical protein
MRRPIVDDGIVLHSTGRCAALVALTMLACSSNEETPQTDAAGTFVGAGAPECPATDPGVDAPCSKENLRCEYGDDFNPACNTWLTCANGGFRSTTLNGVKDPTCPTENVTAPPNPPSCPPSAPKTDDPCTGSFECFYPETSCYCSENGRYLCDEKRLFCKTPRPRIGTPCTPFDECVIQIAGPCDRILMTCSQDKVWVASKAICS